MTERFESVHLHVYSRDVIENILAVHFPTGTVADLTWGKGAFWSDVTRSRVVARLDKMPRYGADAASDCRFVPLRDKAVDVLIFDPPHQHGPSKTTSLKHQSDYDRMPRQADISDLIEATLPELRRVARQGAIVKITDMVESGRYYPQHLFTAVMAEEAGLGLPHDMAILYSGVVRPVRWAQVKHLRHSHSFFLVFKWKGGEK